jgi:hypothetical protein
MHEAILYRVVTLGRMDPGSIRQEAAHTARDLLKGKEAGGVVMTPKFAH